MNAVALKKGLLHVYDYMRKQAGSYPSYDTSLQLWEGLGKPKRMHLLGLGLVEFYVEFNQLKYREVYPDAAEFLVRYCVPSATMYNALK
ncbi:hypothetical protein phiKDA1_3 (endogenous virus) [Enterobacter phage phiKDA1]|uniref:Uncharacterized protein n=1 Tax=Enterobacter phage phiKDA1 TaxID=1147139 RepID=A0A0A6Z5C6_9CAUD|nr:hypothetical protein HOQ86_gp04 [Enterobacter phage phiKDA1]AFE86096.1 hypothetical protein phiKDA1_3 [Enterobacter phage phiKDA1]